MKAQKPAPANPAATPAKAPAKPKAAGTVTSWEELRALALSLDLPNVVETTSWGQPTLKAHGKLWAWWSPSEDAPAFKVSREERGIMLAVEPETFFVTPHNAPHNLVLVRPERCDADWARRCLCGTGARWRPGSS